MVYLPVFVLFLYQKGLSQTNVMVMMSVYNIAIIVGEVPTGIIADKYSRKLSVMIGCVLQGLSMLLMIPAGNYVILLLLEAVFGIGLTFQSGAMSAMFYDYLKSKNAEDLYPGIEGKRWACVFISQALASVFGGVLADVGISITVLITGFAFIISAFVLLFFKEEKNGKGFENYGKHINKTSLKLLKQENIRFLLIVIVLTGALFQTTIWLYQPYYQYIGIKVSNYGWAYVLMNIVSAAGGILSAKLKMNLKRTVFIYMFGNAVFVLIMGICRMPVGVLFPSFVFLINGLANPWIQSFWEKNIEDHERATAASLLSVVSSIVFAIIAIPIGIICDETDVVFALFTTGGTFLIVSMILYLVLLKRDKRKP